MKKTFLNRFIALLVVLSMVASITGCGSGSETASVEESAPVAVSAGTVAEATMSETTTAVSTSTEEPTPEVTASEEITTSPSVEETTAPVETTAVESSAEQTAEPETTPAQTEPVTVEETKATVAPTQAVIETTAAVAPKEEVDENGLTDQQRNSYSMLYHLAITAEEIRTAKDNRLILEDIYTSLLNDINPGAIDETTQDHLANLRDIIKSYLNISVKRDRLQYIYNQNKAKAIRSAVPNPLAILSMSKSLDWKRLVIAAAYTAVDSYKNYKNASDSADQDFLTSGWELDDEETATIQKNRDRAFDYMTDMVQEYGLNGRLTLSEESIEEFNKICSITSIPQKIQRLEAEKETYKLLGNYWLELADCYYENEQYRKCLNCIDKYNELTIDIYRKDQNYAQILPKAIVAAQQIYFGDKYVSTIKKFAQDLLDNTSTTDWSSRYFVAQVYLDLYTKTNDRTYLKKAYDIALNNVTVLLDEQKEINATYLVDVKEEVAEEPDYRFMSEDEKKEAQTEYKAEQKRVKAYNKELKKTRETELPALYEPLILNCDLLFALAEERNIGSAEKSKIEGILQTNTNGVFIADPINDRYSFTPSEKDYSISFTKNEIMIPANLMTDEAVVTVTATNGTEKTVFDDCVVTKVNREGDTVDTFLATVTSDKMNSYPWNADSKVEVVIDNGDENPLTFKFKVTEYTDVWLFPDKVVFGKE